MDVTAKIQNEELINQAKKEEPRFLNILLRDKDSLMDAISFGIRPGRDGHFWVTECRVLYSYIHKYYTKYSGLLTRTAIDTIMDADSTLNEVDGASIRMVWDRIYNTEVSVDDYALLRDSINGRYVQSQAVMVMQENLDKLVRSTGNQIDIVKNIQNSFNVIHGLEADPYCLTMGIDEGLEKALMHITERREYPERQQGILSGIRGIDNAYYGFVPGDYTVVTGMIGGGKTTLMFNIAFNAAKAGYSVLYVSMEKEAVPLYERLLALHAMIDYNRIKRGGSGEHGLSDYYYNKFVEAARDLQENIRPNFECIQTVQGTKISKILADVERVRATKKIDLLVVDYLGVIGHEVHYASRPDLDLADSSQKLQSFGRRNRIAVITALQLKNQSTKEIRSRTKKVTSDSDANTIEVNTEDMAGSQKVIADADNCIGCIMSSEKPPTKVYCCVTKARDSERHRTITLDFDGRIGRISDPEQDPNQIKAVDDILYNAELSRKIMSEDGLFDDEVAGALTTTDSTTTAATASDQKVDDLIGDITKKSDTDNEANMNVINASDTVSDIIFDPSDLML